MRHLIALAGMAVWLSACSSLSKSGCKHKDWLMVGQQDGSRGRSDQLEVWRLNCSSVGASIDEAAYRQGYGEGLLTYCTPEHAYYAGRRGEPFPRVCPEDPRYSVARGYRDGLEYRSHHLK
jgi:Protein of unknown function (DUF2799)